MFGLSVVREKPLLNPKYAISCGGYTRLLQPETAVNITVCHNNRRYRAVSRIYNCFFIKAAENAGKNVINWYCSKIGMEATSFRRGALRNGRSFCLQKNRP